MIKNYCIIKITRTRDEIIETKQCCNKNGQRWKTNRCKEDTFIMKQRYVILQDKQIQYMMIIQELVLLLYDLYNPAVRYNTLVLMVKVINHLYYYKIEIQHKGFNQHEKRSSPQIVINTFTVQVYICHSIIPSSIFMLNKLNLRNINYTRQGIKFIESK